MQAGAWPQSAVVVHAAAQTAPELEVLLVLELEVLDVDVPLVVLALVERLPPPDVVPVELALEELAPPVPFAKSKVPRMLVHDVVTRVIKTATGPA